MRRQAIASRRGARHGAARRPGRRSRRLVGGGLYPEEDEAVAEIIAAFEHESWQAGRARPAPPVRDAATRSKPRSRPGSRPTSCAARRSTSGSTSGLTRTGSWTSQTTLGPLAGPVRRRRCSNAPRCSTAGRASVASTGCRWAGVTNHIHVWKACWSAPASPSPTSRRSGRRSGRSGATRCSRRCARPWAATTSGASGLPMSIEASDTANELEQFHWAYERPGSTATAG